MFSRVSTEFICRDGSTKVKRSKEVEPVLLTIWGVTGHACGLVMLSEEEE